MRRRPLLCGSIALLAAACAHRPAYETRIDGAETPTAECVARVLRSRGDLSIVSEGATTRYVYAPAALSGAVRVAPDRMIYEHTLRFDSRVNDLGEPQIDTINSLGRAIDESVAAACQSIQAARP